MMKGKTKGRKLTVKGKIWMAKMLLDEALEMIEEEANKK